MEVLRDLGIEEQVKEIATPWEQMGESLTVLQGNVNRLHVCQMKRLKAANENQIIKCIVHKGSVFYDS